MNEKSREERKEKGVVEIYLSTLCKVRYMKKTILPIILFLIVSLITGCSLFRDENKEVVEQQVTTFLEGYKEKDASISKLLIGNSESNMTFEGVSAYFAEKLEYKIKSCKKTNDISYSAEVEIKTIDFENLFTSSYKETIEKYGEEGVVENFINEIEQNIKDDNYKIKKVICNVSVKKINDEFKIQMDSSLANALTGGMNEYLAFLQKGE